MNTAVGSSRNTFGAEAPGTGGVRVLTVIGLPFVYGKYKVYSRQGVQRSNLKPPIYGSYHTIYTAVLLPNYGGGRSSTAELCGTVRPFIMQDFFRFKNGPFLPLLFVTSFRTSLFVCRILCAALCKNKHFAFVVLYGDHAYHV